MSEKLSEQPMNTSQVIEFAVELLGNSDILSAVHNCKPENDMMEMAVEYVKSYSMYLQELVNHDLNIKLARSDVEVRDLVSHVNIMLKKKYEPAFTAMALHSPAHYRAIQSSILENAGGSGDR